MRFSEWKKKGKCDDYDLNISQWSVFAIIDWEISQFTLGTRGPCCALPRFDCTLDKKQHSCRDNSLQPRLWSENRELSGAALICEVKVPLNLQLRGSDGGGVWGFDNWGTGAARSREKLRQRQKKKFFQAASGCQLLAHPCACRRPSIPPPSRTCCGCRCSRRRWKARTSPGSRRSASGVCRRGRDPSRAPGCTRLQQESLVSWGH